VSTSAPSRISTQERSTVSRRWVIIGLLTLGTMIAYVDRSNISVALAVPDFKQLFHLTDHQRGALNSAFFWSYAVLQIPAGWLVDRSEASVYDRFSGLEPDFCRHGPGASFPEESMIDRGRVACSSCSVIVRSPLFQCPVNVRDSRYGLQDRLPA